MYQQTEQDVKNLNTCLPTNLRAEFADVVDQYATCWIERKRRFIGFLFAPDVARIDFKHDPRGITRVIVKNDKVRLEVEMAVKLFNDKFHKNVIVY